MHDEASTVSGKLPRADFSGRDEPGAAIDHFDLTPSGPLGEGSGNLAIQLKMACKTPH